MPKLQQQKGGGIITWTPADWVSGLDAQGQFTSQAVIKQTDEYGWQYVNNIDPFQKYGVLSPGLAPNIFVNSSVLTGTVISTQFYSIYSYLFGITTTGQITYSTISGLTPTITSNAYWPYTITGTSPVGQDCLIYTSNFAGSGSVLTPTSLFYSYYTANGWNVGILADLLNNNYSSDSNFDDSFISSGVVVGNGPILTIQSGSTVTTNGTTTVTGTGTQFTQDLDVGDLISVDGLAFNKIVSIQSDTQLTVTSSIVAHSNVTWTYFPQATNNTGKPLPLCIGGDGTLYIGNGNYLHSYDGTIGPYGTFYQKVLSLSSNSVIIGMIPYNNSLLIAYNDTLALQAYAGVWDYESLNLTQVIPLEDNTVSSIFIYRGKPTVITTGIKERNGNNKIKFITGISTTKLADFDGIAPSQRGILVADTVIYMNCGGKILSCGDRFNPKSYAINNISNCNLTGTSGFIYYNTANQSLTASGGLSIDNFDSKGTSAATINSSFLQVPFSPQTVGKIKNIQVNYYNGLSVNASNGLFSLLFGFEYQTPNVTVVDGLTSVVASSNILTKKYLWDSSGKPFPYFTSLAPKMTWTASTVGVPLVSSLSVEYDEVQLPLN